MLAFRALSLFLLGFPVVMAASPPELSTDWILHTIQERHLTDIEQLLGAFSPSSLKYHLYAYGSESQQHSSWLNPRVIVYSYDADFIMAFNGEKGSEGYYDLEILRFDPHGWKFIPEAIHFDPRGKAAPRPDLHPTECAHCHQNDIRPNWDPYFHWVGFYGSEDDNRNAYGNYPGNVLTGTVETNHFAEFLNKQKAEIALGHGRYRFLPPHPAERPNLHFNDRITCLNMKRLLRVFASHPEATRLWSAVRGGRVDLGEIPDDLKKRARHTWEEVLTSTDEGIYKAAQRRLARQALLTGEANPKGRIRFLKDNHGALVTETREAAEWRYLFEEILHEPFRPMATSRHPDYQLNIDGTIMLAQLIRNTEIDERTGEFRHETDPNDRIVRSEQDYDYYCPLGQTALESAPAAGRN